VCYTGTIGFVGLVGPHIARLFVGNNNKLLIPLSAIIGALMVVGADCIVRLLPVVLPVGVITALIGSPLFLYFLYSQRKKSVW
ncbi:MAG: iron chelate uptake ABC transporter family permease subunit, partial [Candidatus Methanomethylophilaceae archaeon]|nr:iron chelate uptake ABC transporter family permease subunit [Candidatus Methanomethylophilaceae archaeon]